MVCGVGLSVMSSMNSGTDGDKGGTNRVIPKQLFAVIAGFILAAICFYLFREQSRHLPVIKNPRIGIYYFAGACVCLAVAFVCRPWTTILWWPATSLLIMSTAYCGIGPVIYRKENGRLPLSTHHSPPMAAVRKKMKLSH